MKVGIYVRLSKEDDDVRKHSSAKTESESIQNQKSLLVQYAMDRGYDIYNIYCDEDYSGIDRDRPDFKRLIQDASEHKFDIVLAKSQSRFTRDMELVEKYLHGKFVEWGIRFIAVADHVDTDDPSNKKTRQINGLVNEWYLEDLSNNVRTVLTHKRQSGQYIGSFALYGYQKDPANHNHLVIDPEAAQVVQRIFSMALAGYGLRRIARTLNQEGIPNPSCYKWAHGMAFYSCFSNPEKPLWNPATIRSILQNRTYTGDLVQGRHKKTSYKSQKILNTPKDQWMIVPDTHEPLIDKKEFERLQEMRGRGVQPCSTTGMVRPLARKVFCGCCGSSMYLVRNNKDCAYLRCRLRTANPSLCSNVSIAAAGLDQIILERIQEHLRTLFDPNAVDFSPITQQQEQQQKRYNADLQVLQEKLFKCDHALRVLYEDKLSGLLDDAMFMQLNQDYLHEKDTLTEQIGRLERSLASIPPNREALLEKAREAAHNLTCANTLTRELVCSLIDSIHVGPVASPKDKTRTIEVRWLF